MQNFGTLGQLLKNPPICPPKYRILHQWNLNIFVIEEAMQKFQNLWTSPFGREESESERTNRDKNAVNSGLLSYFRWSTHFTWTNHLFNCNLYLGPILCMNISNKASSLFFLKKNRASQGQASHIFDIILINWTSSCVSFICKRDVTIQSRN